MSTEEAISFLLHGLLYGLEIVTGLIFLALLFVGTLFAIAYFKGWSRPDLTPAEILERLIDGQPR